MKPLLFFLLIFSASCNTEDRDVILPQKDMGKEVDSQKDQKDEILKLCEDYQKHFFETCLGEVCDPTVSPSDYLEEKLKEYEDSEMCAKEIRGKKEKIEELKNGLSLSCKQLKTTYCLLGFNNVCDCKINTGVSCETEKECIFGSLGGECIDLHEGYCSSLCSTDGAIIAQSDDCGDGMCLHSAKPKCVATCTKTDDCRDGYSCQIVQVPTAQNAWKLVRFCNSDSELDCTDSCANGTLCVEGKCKSNLLWECGSSDKGGLTASARCKSLGGSCTISNGPSYCLLP